MLKLKTVCMGILLAFCVSFFNVPAFAAEPATKVACIGDSITAGAGTTDRSMYSYPSQLQKLLGTNYIVKNYGVSGRTMLKKGDYPYWKEAAFTDSKNWQPNIVIIQLGTNDTKPQNWAYKSEFVSDYVEMVNAYKNLASRPTVYVCYCPTVYPNSGSFSQSETIFVNEMIPMVKQVASQTGAIIIDNHAATSNMPANFPDCVHPNNTGAFALAFNVFKSLALPRTKVSFYEDADYKGAVVSLPSGNYTGGMLLAAGIRNDRMSSLKIPGGYKVEVYEHGDFSGAKWTFTADTSYVGDACNDKMSSFKIIPSGPTFYENADYTGGAAILEKGEYLLSQMLAAGVPDNWVSALKVPKGYTVEIYQNGDFTGTKWTFTADTSYVGAACNDQMSSVRIY